MENQNSNLSVLPLHTRLIVRPRMLPRMACIALALVVCGLLARTADAQFVRMRAGQIRITVPINTTTSTLLTNQATMAGINGSGISFNVSGLPPQAGYTLSAANLTATGPLTITVNATNVPEGS